MNRRWKYILPTVISLLLCTGLLFGAAFSAQSAADTQNRLHYGKEGNVGNETLSASALFEALFGYAPITSEKTYLDELSGITLKYSATQAALAEGISTDYHKEEGSLEVFVSAYTYTALNGAVVEWIPKTVRIATEDGALEQPLVQNGEGYGCTFTEFYQSGNFDMEVTFDWSEELPREAVEELLNAAYGAGSAALEIILADEAAQKQYEDDLAAFHAYQAYLAQKEKYDDYVKAYTQYKEIDLPAYQAYQSAYAAYQADMEAYEAWQLYFDIVNSGTTFDDYVAYQNYLLKMEKMKQRLNVLEVLFLKDSHGWDLYDSLMGGSVTAALLGNKSELEAAGFKAQVQASEESTVALRTLMKGYSDLRDAEYASEHDKTVALYTYYLDNYAGLRDNFVKLSTALYDFLKSPSVCLGIKEMGGADRFAHYEQFVALLYTTSTALDDGVKRPEFWSGYAKNYTDFLDAELLVPDSNTATPAATDIPAAEVPEVEWMDAPPDLPQITKKPVLSNYLSEDVKAYLSEHGANSLDTAPVEPPKVDDPSLGTVPTPTESPVPPVPTQLDARLSALAEDVRAEKLKFRSAEAVNTTLQMSKTVERLVSVDNKKVITFYAADRQTVLDRQTVEYGSTITYGGDSAVFTREPSVSHTYAFLGWYLPDGTRAEMIAYSDLSLYAGYSETLRFYTVTWVLDGVQRSESLAYGTTPKCPFETQKAPDAGYTYEFSGWRADTTGEIGVLTVTGDVTYTGSITRIPKTFTVTWALGDRTETDTVAYGTYPAYKGSLSRTPDAYSYTFLKWDKTLDWVHGDVTYTAVWETTKLATAIDGTVMQVTHTDDRVIVVGTQEKLDIREAAKLAQAEGKALTVQWEQFSLTVANADLGMLTATSCRRIQLTERRTEDYGEVYTFAYFNSAGQALSLEVPATLMALPDTDGTPSVGYLAQDGTWRLVGAEAVSVVGGASFRINNTYAIDVADVEKCNLGQLPTSAMAGTRIDLKLGCVFGYEVSSASVTLADGNAVAVEDLSFVMPQGAVHIELTVTPIIYHVTFVADGKVIAEGDYMLGEKIQLPADPSKASDGIYDYTFGGWSQDITVAYGDDRNPVYEAVFSATPIVVDHHKLSRIDIIVTIVLPIVGVLAVVAIGVLVTLRVLKKKKASALKSTEVAPVAEPAPEPTEDLTEPHDMTDEV